MATTTARRSLEPNRLHVDSCNQDNSGQLFRVHVACEGDAARGTTTVYKYFAADIQLCCTHRSISPRQCSSSSTFSPYGRDRAPLATKTVVGDEPVIVLLFIADLGLCSCLNAAPSPGPRAPLPGCDGPRAPRPKCDAWNCWLTSHGKTSSAAFCRREFQPTSTRMIVKPSSLRQALSAERRWKNSPADCLQQNIHN
jgi:hypothetical protein